MDRRVVMLAVLAVPGRRVIGTRMRWDNIVSSLSGGGKKTENPDKYHKVDGPDQGSAERAKEGRRSGQMEKVGERGFYICRVCLTKKSGAPWSQENHSRSNLGRNFS